MIESDKPRKKAGRPKGSRDGYKRAREIKKRDHRKGATISDLVSAACRNGKKGPVDVRNALQEVKVRWEDLEEAALAFLKRGLELLPNVQKATDALICADKIMSILEKKTEMQSAAKEVLKEYGLTLRFSTVEELGLDDKGGENGGQ